MYVLEDGNLGIEDTRFGAENYHLNTKQSAVYKAIEDPIHYSKLETNAELMQKISAVELHEIVAFFVEKKLAISEKNTYLALALSPNSPEPDQQQRMMVVNKITLS